MSYVLQNCRGQYGRRQPRLSGRASVGAEHQVARIELPGVALEMRGAHVADQIANATITVGAIGAGALITAHIVKILR